MEPEVTVHQCHPSQIVNLKNFFFAFLGIAAVIALRIATGRAILLSLLIVPLVYAFWKWLQVTSTKLTITDQRLIVRSGIFTKITNETPTTRRYWIQVPEIESFNFKPWIACSGTNTLKILFSGLKDYQCVNDIKILNNCVMPG